MKVPSAPNHESSFTSTNTPLAWGYGGRQVHTFDGPIGQVQAQRIGTRGRGVQIPVAQHPARMAASQIVACRVVCVSVDHVVRAVRRQQRQTGLGVQVNPVCLALRKCQFLRLTLGAHLARLRKALRQGLA